MSPYGLYSLANTPEELLSRGYGNIDAFDASADKDFDLARSLVQYDPAFGELNATRRYQAAPFTGKTPFQNMYDVAPNYFNGIDIGQLPYDIPSYGGISGYRDVGGNQVQDTDIMQQAPLMQGVSDMSRIDETTNDEQNQNYIDPVNKKSSLKDSLSNMGKKFGLSSLLGLITGNPILGLIGRGAGGLGSLNNKMQNSVFGLSPTLKDYFNTRKEIKEARKIADTPGTDNQDGTGGYSGGFDASTDNYNDPYSESGDTE
jgi:hypothetical protein